MVTIPRRSGHLGLGTESNLACRHPGRYFQKPAEYCILPLRVESDIEQTHAQRGPIIVDDFWQHVLKIEERGYAFLGDSPCQLDVYQVVD